MDQGAEVNRGRGDRRMAFGALKSVILISAFLLLLTAISIPSENNRNSSLLYDHVIFAAPLAFDMIATIYPEADSFVQTIEKSLQENNPLRSLPDRKSVV